MSSAAVTGKAPLPGSREIELSIRGTTCAAYARVKKKLDALDDVTATVNLATEKAMLIAPPPVPVQRLIQAVEQAGYEAVLTGPAATSDNGGADAPRGTNMSGQEVT
jgi:P-type Cu+ transporter